MKKTKEKLFDGLVVTVDGKEIGEVDKNAIVGRWSTDEEVKSTLEEMKSTLYLNDGGFCATTPTLPTSTGAYLCANINSSSATFTVFSGEEEELSNELTEVGNFYDETARIRRVLGLKKYNKKFNFSISEPVCLATFSYMAGVDDKMDVMKRNFVGGEKLVLKNVKTPMSNGHAYRNYLFLVENKFYIELDEDRCFDYVDGFNDLIEAVEMERKAEELRIKRKQEKEMMAREEAELEKIAAQALREEMGYGIWS